MLLEAPYSDSRVAPSANSRMDQPFTQLALSNGEAKRSIEWRSETADRLLLTGTMSEISNMVYERLLSRPGLPVSEGNKVFTLPANDGAEARFLAGSKPNTHGALTQSSAVSASASRKILNGETAVSRDTSSAGNANAIVRETNHYLTELQLPQLTGAEVARLVERSSDAYDDFQPGPGRNEPNGNSHTPIHSRLPRWAEACSICLPSWTKQHRPHTTSMPTIET
jgi:hypothetical protein